jgi:CBS domain-containing protein
LSAAQLLPEIRPSELIYVKEIMQRDVKTARPESTAKEVVEKMNRFNIGSIVILQKKRPVGIITERDVLQRVVENCIDPSICKAREIMTSPTQTATEDTPVNEIIKLMTSRRIKKVPILRNQTLVGIVTATDLLDKNPSLIQLRRRPRAWHGD